MWAVAKVYSNNSAQVGIVQTRNCDLCGYTQVDVKRDY